MFTSPTKMRWTAWVWEYSAVLGSIASFAAMVAVLASFNGKEVIAWKGVTLNAVVSILSLAVKASLAFVLAECMAQWKWILFVREPRPLMDFERIDAATRGPLGSLRVLTKTKGPLALQFGAILTLLIIGLDPFAQQLMQFRSDFEEESSASVLIARTNWYNMGTAPTNPPDPPNQPNSTNSSDPTHGYTVKPELPLSMQSAVLAGLSRTPEEVEQEVLVQCPTSNCTWAPFNTLGVCHRCNNVTADLRRVDGRDSRFVEILDATFGPIVYGSVDGRPLGLQEVRPFDVPTTAYSLSNGHFIANGNGCSLDDHSRECDIKLPGTNGVVGLKRYTITSFGTGNPNKTNTMKDIDTLIWSMSVISPNVGEFSASPVWPNVTMQAMECAIYYCVKKVTSSMESNQLFENITEVHTVQDPDSWQRIGNNSEDSQFPPFVPPPGNLEFDPLYSLASYSDLHLNDPSTNEPYKVNDDSVKSISAYFRSLFLANFSRDVPVPGMADELEKLLHKGAVGVNGASFTPPPSQTGKVRVEVTPLALKNLWTWTRYNMTRTFYTLATSMTNEMRRNSEAETNPNLGQDTEGTMKMKGNQRIWTVRYEIQWAWIALHGITLLLGVVFLGITLWNSGTGGAEPVPLWKSSTLATIRRGYQIGAALEGANTVQEMESAARKAYVKVPSGDVEESTACIYEDHASAAGCPDR
ncbi:hypothetical protein C8A01DRAFT_16797 [Parachaetomium inaequale]|uniref:Uncharacterized protein n=1 Tax=Parachaetomium inaequale TaxID=2588326 RepID=A0AAN6PE04_9PEZI|nr:hypothetical protein C8A01DRAFT_16797 [Parachaetomium inaequale]